MAESLATNVNGALARLRQQQQEFAEKMDASREAGKQAAHQALVDGLTYRALVELEREVDAMAFLEKHRVGNIPDDVFEREAFVDQFCETCANARDRAKER
ncbi:MAG: hypothetical protein WD063_08505 [Pirellulales bacterium]